MQKKILFSLVVLEGVGILGLLYLIWNHSQNTEQVLLSETLISISAFAALACIVVGWVQIKSPASMVDIEAGRCLLYTSPSPRDLSTSRMPSSA